MALIDEFLDRGGQGAVVMASEPALEDLQNNTPPELWGKLGNWTFYRGHRVEPHDEWSWGWMVRKADGSFVSRDEASPHTTP